MRAAPLALALIIALGLPSAAHSQSLQTVQDLPSAGPVWLSRIARDLAAEATGEIDIIVEFATLAGGDPARLAPAPEAPSADQIREAVAQARRPIKAGLAALHLPIIQEFAYTPHLLIRVRRADLPNLAALDGIVAATPNFGPPAVVSASDEGPSEQVTEFTKLLASLTGLYTSYATADSRVLALSTPAADAWFAFAREVEAAMGADGAFASIAAFAGLLPEHAARLGAVFALVEDVGVSEIGAAALERGVGLARFYAAEAVRMFDFAPPQVSGTEKVEALKAWLARRPGEKLRLRDICTFGPPVIRNIATAYAIMRDLERAGVVEPANDETKSAEKGRRPRVPYQWRVIPQGESAMQRDAA